MSEKSAVFKKKWACEIHPSCLYCIPCDCNNCKGFEKSLRNSVLKSNQEKDRGYYKTNLPPHLDNLDE